MRPNPNFRVDPNIWTAVACLKADPKVKDFRRFGKGKGAYVNVVAWAKSATHFKDKVRRHTEPLDCILVELENVQLLDSRMGQNDFPEELITMRDPANRQQEDTVWGTFHVWNQEDPN